MQQPKETSRTISVDPIEIVADMNQVEIPTFVTGKERILSAEKSLFHNPKIQEALFHTVITKRLGAGATRVAYRLGAHAGTNHMEELATTLFHSEQENSTSVVMKIHAKTVVDVHEYMNSKSMHDTPENIALVIARLGAQAAVRQLRERHNFSTYETAMTSDNCIAMSEVSGFYAFPITKGELYILSGGPPNDILAKDPEYTLAVGWVSFQKEVDRGVSVQGLKFERAAFREVQKLFNENIPPEEYERVENEIDLINDMFLLGDPALRNIDKATIIESLGNYGSASTILKKVLDAVQMQNPDAENRKQALKEFIRNAIEYTYQTGLVIDINGSNNVLLVDGPHDLRCIIIDGFRPESRGAVEFTREIGLSIIESGLPMEKPDVITDDLIQVYILLEYARTLNLMAYLLDMDERLYIFSEEESKELRGGKIDTTYLAFKIYLS